MSQSLFRREVIDARLDVPKGDQVSAGQSRVVVSPSAVNGTASDVITEFYRISVALERQAISVYDKPRLLKPGIVTDCRCSG